MRTLVVFTLDAQRYAVHLPVVSRVIRAVEIARLPKAPAIVLGVINVHGQIVPVVDVRTRFGLPRRELEPGDQFVLARAGSRNVALVVDFVSGIVDCPEESIVALEQVAGGVEYVAGIAKLADGVTLIHDLETFLSLDEKKSLDRALAKRKA